MFLCGAEVRLPLFAPKGNLQVIQTMPKTVSVRRMLVVVLFAQSSAAVVQAVASGGGDSPMWGGTPARNMVSQEKDIPAQWDIGDRRNVKWETAVGSYTYGTPVIADGMVLVGTNNAGGLRAGIAGDKGVLVCLEEKTGKFLWQATHDKLPSGDINDWPEQGIASAPFVEGDRLYYVSNRCELVCADLRGFLDEENDGPYKSERLTTKQDADIVWILDMYKDLKVFPHNLANCSPVGYKGMLYVSTGNGVGEDHKTVPSPHAPDLLAVDMKSGKVVWSRNDVGTNVLHGQWSSPAVGMVKGSPQVVFAGGDGWCYSYEAATGKPLWKFNLNPPGTLWKVGGRGDKNSIVATPVVYEDNVYIAVGQDPDNGEGPGHLYSIDATGTGDITKTGGSWHVGGEDFHRSLSNVAVADGLLYAADLSGFLYCFDLLTGRKLWSHDTYAAIWGSPYVVDGKVMVATVDGEVVVLKHSREHKELATNDVGNSVYTTPVAANGTLYLSTRRSVLAIAAGAGSAGKQEKSAE